MEIKQSRNLRDTPEEQAEKLEKYEKALEQYANVDNWSHVDGWPQAFNGGLNGYDLARSVLGEEG